MILLRRVIHETLVAPRRVLLLLSELPEFARDALEVLRQPLEDGVVNVSRVNAAYTYPADFCLIAAMNPCPCGYYGNVGKGFVMPLAFCPC
jgi:predicted ATPase with chaperone activity